MEKNMDFTQINANIDKVKAIKAAKERRPSTSVRPLTFEPNEDDSPLKAEIIKRINDKNLTYSDLHNYCAKIKGGDSKQGSDLAINIINGLRKRPSMMDTTFYMLCDFLNLEIRLVDISDDGKDPEFNKEN